MTAPSIDAGDTAWMLAATALVLLMTPALGLFYAGLVRVEEHAQHVHDVHRRARRRRPSRGRSSATRSRSTRATASSAASTTRSCATSRFDAARRAPTIPHLLFFAFQATFCIITAALVSGAVVERMRFGPFLVFMALWSVLVYAVLAHWVFGGGWLQQHGTLDFAGGVPVEMGSGFSALAAALVVGARKDYGRQALLPHNAVYVLLGAGLLWFGWFGFNGGSGYSDRATRRARVHEHAARARRARWSSGSCSTCSATAGDGDRRRDGDHRRLRRRSRRPPASSARCRRWLLGALAALPSYAFIVWRPRTRLDETLDVLAAHGLGGLTGILFIGFFAQLSWNGVADGLLYGNAGQLGWQAIAALAAPAYAFVGDVRDPEADRRWSCRCGRPSARRRSAWTSSQHGEEAYADAARARSSSRPRRGRGKRRRSRGCRRLVSGARAVGPSGALADSSDKGVLRTLRCRRERRRTARRGHRPARRTSKGPPPS